MNTRLTNIRLASLLFLFLTMLAGCDKKKDKDTDGSPSAAVLSYTPNCATIKGSVRLPTEKKNYVFQHDIDPEFQKQEVKVWIKYRVEGPSNNDKMEVTLKTDNNDKMAKILALADQLGVGVVTNTKKPVLPKGKVVSAEELLEIFGQQPDFPTTEEIRTKAWPFHGNI